MDKDINERLKQLEAAEYEAANVGGWNPDEQSLAEWIEELILINKQLEKEKDEPRYCGLINHGPYCECGKGLY